MWEDGGVGKWGEEAAGSFDACLCKGQLYYAEIEGAQQPELDCQLKKSKCLSGAEEEQSDDEESS